VSTLFGLGRGFNKDLSGRENIRLYATLLGIRRQVIRERMDEIVEFTELGDFIDEPVAHYSSGMRARLAFSVAMVLESDVLLLDEVLSVGDVGFQAKSTARLRERMSRSRLIAVVSHQMSLLRNVATHALWLEKGRMRAFGTASEVLDAYDRAGPARGAVRRIA
jgi:ABC-type polysaccharide/polyol phosphate transport system ATPase subunit